MVKVISFDFDGTLIESRADKQLWNKQLPLLYSIKYKVRLKDAIKKLKLDYKEYFPKFKEKWFSIDHWLKFYKLDNYSQEILKLIQSKINYYKDVKPTLKLLKKQGYKLILISAAEKKILNAKLEVENLKQYFTKIYSALSDFKKSKKDVQVYKSVLKQLKIKPKEMLHIGDNFNQDYLTPKKLGINAILIDRSKKNKRAIHNLKQLKNIVQLKES